MNIGASIAPEEYSFPDNLLPTLLAVSLTAVNLLRPLYGPDGEQIVDFFLDYLNPAAQRIAGLPEQPQQTALSLFPGIIDNGVLDFYRRTYQRGEADTFQFNYQADGLDNFFRLSAQRCGHLLVVSFTDTSDQPRTPVENALRESQAAERAARADAEAQRQRLNDFMSGAPGVVLSLLGPQHIIEFANEGFRQQVGVPNPIGNPFLEVVAFTADQYAPEYQATDLYDYVYRTGEPYYVAEAPYYVDPTQSGQRELHYFTFSVQPTRDSSGHIIGVQSFATDVTDQVLARQQVLDLNEKLTDSNEELAVSNEELRANNEQYLQTNTYLAHVEQELRVLNQELEARIAERTQQVLQQSTRLERLLQEAPAAICMLDGPELVFELVNPGYQQLFPDRDLLGKSVFDVLPEIVGGPVEDMLRRVYATGKTFEGREVHMQFARPGDGQLTDIFFNFIYQARYDAAGKIDGLVVFAFDVSEQVLGRQKVEQASVDLRLLMAGSPGFLFRTDALGRLTYLNDSFFEWTGLDPAGLATLDEGWATVYPGDLAMQQPSFVAAVQAGQPWESTPYRFRRHDGQYRWMLSRSQPLLGAEGQVTGQAGITFEIHEQVELQRRLERTNADLDTFVYAASHDLKAPIANIEGLLNALRDYLPTAAQQPMVPRLVGMMEGAISRFQQTVGHLTDVSRLQESLPEQPVEELNVPQVLEDVRLDLLPLLESTHAELAATVATCPRVRFSTKSLRSVLFNLLSNAVKYRAFDRAPYVQVRSLCTAKHFVLEVQDNGLGLTPAQQGQLFTMFRRLHNHVEGSGVGLYLIKRTVENAGGTITVLSQVGIGSTFTVTLPCA